MGQHDISKQISPELNDLCMILVKCMHGILELWLQLPNKNLLSSTDAFKTTTLVSPSGLDNTF